MVFLLPGAADCRRRRDSALVLMELVLWKMDITLNSPHEPL